MEISTKAGPSILNYAIIVRPGEVWHIEPENFICGDIECLISKIRGVGAEPKIRTPLTFFVGGREDYSFCKEVNELLVGIPGLGWEECLRVHHALGSNFHSLEMRAEVYCRFHRFLRLGRNFGIAQCTEAWIKISDRDPVLLESYIPSPRHLVLKSKGGEYAVFNKTAFVQSRLDAMAEEDRLKAESEEAQRAAALAEQLRRSRFTTFVYLMEDPRNGAFKIGRSQTPGIRERTLQSEVPETLLRFSIPAEETHERELHALFQHRRVRGEWFDLTTNDVFAVIAFLKEHGDPERASGDFHWLGRLFATSRPNRSSAQPDPGSSAYS